MTSTSEHQEAKRILAAWVPVTLAEQIQARAETERQSAGTFAHEAARRLEMAQNSLEGCGREGPVTESARNNDRRVASCEKKRGNLG